MYYRVIFDIRKYLNDPELSMTIWSVLLNDKKNDEKCTSHGPITQSTSF